MAKRRWTVVFVPHDSEPSKIVEVSYRVVKIGAGGSGLCGGCGALRGLRDDLADGRPLEIGPPGARKCTAGAAARRTERPAHRPGRHPLPHLPARRPHQSPRQSRADRSAGAGRRYRRSHCGARSSGEVGGAMRRSNEIRVDLNALIRRANLLASSFQEAADSLAVHSARLAATPSIMPTQGWLTSAFSSMRAHPILHFARPHEGIDVTAPMGTPIEAPAAGMVRDAGWEAGYGNTIVDRPRFRHRDEVRARLEDPGARGAAGHARPADRAGRQHRTRHRSAPALRSARQRPRGGSAPLRDAGARRHRLRRTRPSRTRPRLGELAVPAPLAV